MSDPGSGAGGGTARLRAFAPASGYGGSSGRPLFARFAGLDPVVDLGDAIGSRDWWRGLATCTALCGSAIAFWPTLPTLPTLSAPAPAAPTEAQWQEMRAQAIAPLALGADTGRRMAPTAAVQPLADTPERPSVTLAATLGRGDGFLRVLERSGVGAAEAASVTAMVAGVVPLGAIPAGTRLDLTLGRRADPAQPRPITQLAFRARFDLIVAVTRVDGRLRLAQTPIAVDETPLRIRGRVGSGLYLAARAAGAPVTAVAAYLRALGSRIAVGRAIRPDDRFDIIVEHRRAATGETRTGKLLYAGLQQAHSQVRLLQWTVDGRTQWYEASGVGERRGTMQSPVTGHVSSGFGMRRHPILGFSRFHRGMDFAAAYGSPIVAAADGVIAFAGWHGGHGQFVQIRHDGGLGTGYGHMSRIIARPGAHVVQGQLIGYVGSTGLSTGPHLHYEIYRGGVTVDPASVRFVTTAKLAGRALADFQARLRTLTSINGSAPGRADPTKDAIPGG